MGQTRNSGAWQETERARLDSPSGAAASENASNSENESIFAFRVTPVIRVPTRLEASQHALLVAKGPTPSTASQETDDETEDGGSEDTDSELDATDGSSASIIEAFLASEATVSPRILPVLLGIQDDILERISVKLKSITVHPSPHGARQHPYSSPTSPTSNLQGTGSRRAAGASSRGSQGRRADEDDDISGRDNSDGQEKNSRKPVLGPGGQMFACPFFKRYPGNAKVAQSCSRRGWPRVHRLREHLRRNHTRPQSRCHRCQGVFKKDTELSTHLQQAAVCERIEPSRDEMTRFMSEDQRVMLTKLRKKKGIDEKVRWFGLFRLLFGDIPDDELPSPYLDDDIPSDPATICRLEAFLLRELPCHMWQRLSNDMGSASAGINEATVSQASHDATKEVFGKFMSTLPSHTQNLDSIHIPGTRPTVETSPATTTSTSLSPFVTTSRHPVVQDEGVQDEGAPLGMYSYDHTYTYEISPVPALHMPHNSDGTFPDVPDADHGQDCHCLTCLFPGLPEM